jgi:hypothetical protein
MHDLVEAARERRVERGWMSGGRARHDEEQDRLAAAKVKVGRARCVR